VHARAKAAEAPAASQAVLNDMEVSRVQRSFINLEGYHVCAKATETPVLNKIGQVPKHTACANALQGPPASQSALNNEDNLHDVAARTCQGNWSATCKQ